jgi:hypothetical protein
VTTLATSCAPLLRRLFDDAAIFPPGNAPMSQALTGHVQHQKAWYAATVGPFVCSDRRWAELQATVPSNVDSPLDLALVVTGGLQSVANAVALTDAEPRVALRAVEVAADAAEDAVNVLDRLPATVQGYLELQPPADLAALAGTRHRAKFRTGGDSAPDPAALAEAVVAAVTHGVSFKLTGGLHHAVADGAGQQGFLNVLVAVTQAIAGAPTATVGSVLTETDGDNLVEHVHRMSAGQMGRTRELFVSFGTCSISEPLADLRTLGLVAP